jgi:hypothetical protein
MNEYGDASATGRLVGTLHAPEGQLTSLIRQRPHAVLLLDEIEKAHPDVFDLLLQLLDDGRLTDALGRTADFSNAIVILTSNLGAKTSQKNLGFNAEPDPDGLTRHFTRAAEQFFRPEFFNRLDRIVAFAPLLPATMRDIAERVLRDVLHREGLVRRRCLLDIAPGTLDHLAAQGYDPDFGARALKRVVERSLTRPVAAKLAGLDPEKTTVIRVGAEAELDVSICALQDKVIDPNSAAAWLQTPDKSWQPALENTLESIERRLAAFRPDGAINAAGLDESAELYFKAKDDLERAWAMWLSKNSADEPSHALADAKISRRGARQRKAPLGVAKSFDPTRHEVAAGEAFRDDITALSDLDLPAPGTNEPWHERVLGECAWLSALLAAGPTAMRQRVDIRCRRVGSDDFEAKRFCRSVLDALAQAFGLDWHWLPSDDASPREGPWLACVQGPLARRLFATIAGSHVLWSDTDELSLVVLAEAAATSDLALPPVCRVYHGHARYTDLATGIGVAEDYLVGQAMRRLCALALPAPFAAAG